MSTASIHNTHAGLPSPPLASNEEAVQVGRKRKTSLEDKDTKTKERILRNRAAAQDSRDRKRRYIAGLESTNSILSAENERLTKRLKTVEEENEALQAKVDFLTQQLAGLQKNTEFAEITRILFDGFRLASVVTALPSSNWKRHPLMNEDAMIDATNACDGFKITNPTSGEDVVEGTPNQNVAWDAGVSRIKQVTRIEILDASGRVADYRAGAWNATDGWEMDHELNLTSKTPGQYRYRLSAEAEDGRLCYYQSPYFDLLAPTSSNSTADNTKAAAVAAPVNGTLVTEPSACDGFTITNPTNEET
ncbi:hypothetical protein BZG36_05706, partial [Bifiguratus adelaidae]